MHTIIVIGVGLLLLGACALGGGVLAGAPGIAKAMLIFLPIWLVGAAINMYIGVKHAGYSVAQEAPVFFLVLAVPSLAALIAWWVLRSTTAG